MTHTVRSIFVVATFLPVLLASCQPAAIAGAPGIGDTYYAELGNGGYDVQRYVISLDVAPDARLINGKATIEAVATERLASFNLDFQGLEIDSIMVDGSNARYAREGHELTITPAHPLRREKEFVAQIAYHGTPSPIRSAAFPSEVGWFFADSGAVNVISEPDGASTWFPANDHPLDKALYRFEISVPQPWVVAATGTLLETTADGANTRFVFEMDSPMASYLAGVYIDHYKVDIREGPGGVMIRNVIPETVDASLITNLERLPDMLSYFAGLFGPYPYTVYGVVIANPTIPPCANPFGIALEAQTQSLHCPKIFMFTEAVLAHELAHQWFGNSVSLERWQDVWLKEGLATYAGWLWTTKESGLDGLNELVATERDRLIIKAPIAQPAPEDLYGWQVYMGGALVLHDLRLRLGDDAFFIVLREYARRYKDGNAGLDDFIAEAQKESTTGLQPFFDSWLLDTELPETLAPES